MPNPDRTSPVILLTGVTGNSGRKIVEEIEAATDKVNLRFCSRRPEQVNSWAADGRDAVLLDLDEPRTFGKALAGVDRLYVITGYTVDMVTQAKTLVDAAIKAGVSHIVHQGIFANWDTTDPHFVWHQLIEKYIEASGIAWTHLHPNYFMENLIWATPIRNSAFPVFVGDRRRGLIALKDLGAVAAKVLLDGPDKHGGKNYWLSTESLNGAEMAETLSAMLGHKIECDMKAPKDFKALIESLPAGTIEANYAASAIEFFQQVFDGRMAYIGTVRDDVPYILGREAPTFRDWAKENNASLEVS